MRKSRNWRDAQPDPAKRSQLGLEVLTPKTCTRSVVIIIQCCLGPPRFGVICYAAVGDQYGKEGENADSSETSAVDGAPPENHDEKLALLGSGGEPDPWPSPVTRCDSSCPG